MQQLTHSFQTPANKGYPKISKAPDQDFDVVHAHCEVALKEAESYNRRLVNRLNEKQREMTTVNQRIDRERVQAGARLSQMSLEKQKAVDEAHRLRKEILEVQERLDAALNDSRNFVSRVEVQGILNEVHGSAEAFMKVLSSKMSDNENVQLSAQLPASAVVEDPWTNQYGPFEMLQDPVGAGSDSAFQLAGQGGPPHLDAMDANYDLPDIEIAGMPRE